MAKRAKVTWNGNQTAGVTLPFDAMEFEPGQTVDDLDPDFAKGFAHDNFTVEEYDVPDRIVGGKPKQEGDEVEAEAEGVAETASQENTEQQNAESAEV